MDAVVLAPLSNIDTHLNSLITSLTQTNTFTLAPQIANNLVTNDDDLKAALSLLQRHQQNYARILNLRREVASLQEQLKDTVRSCVSFKREIGEVNPSILESDSEDDEDDEERARGIVAEVDYHTLLTFAARIGKHNTLAAKEAEAEAVRRKIAAKATTVNGTAAVEAGEDSNTSAGAGNKTIESTAELDRIDAAIALQRAHIGMSFPDAAVLRNGALGQLTLFAEKQRLGQSGAAARGMSDVEKIVNEALDREVGTMVRDTEDVTPEIAPEGKAPAQEIPALPDSPVVDRSMTDLPAQQAPTSQAQRKPPRDKKPLNLNFPGSDSEDDDDD